MPAGVWRGLLATKACVGHRCSEHVVKQSCREALGQRKPVASVSLPFYHWTAVLQRCYSTWHMCYVAHVPCPPPPHHYCLPHASGCTSMGVMAVEAGHPVAFLGRREVADRWREQFHGQCWSSGLLLGSRSDQRRLDRVASLWQITLLSRTLSCSFPPTGLATNPHCCMLLIADELSARLG